MEQLFELLREDAPLPPSEVDIEKAVRAGRRRVRTRWLGAAGIVIVVLSLVPVIVLVGGTSVQPADPPAADFDPMRRVVAIDESVASIRDYDTARRWQQVFLGTRTGEAGLLTVYAPGRRLMDTDGPVRLEAGTRTDPVNGRSAYWITHGENVSLAWQWTDGAWALLDLDDNVTMKSDRDAMRRIAHAVRVSAGVPVTEPFTLPRLAHADLVGTSTARIPGDFYIRTDLHFATSDPAHPDRTTYPEPTSAAVANDRRTSIGVNNGLETGQSNPRLTANGHHALVADGTVIVFDVVGQFDVIVSGSGDPEALLAIAETVRLVPNPDDESTWTAEPLT